MSLLKGFVLAFDTNVSDNAIMAAAVKDGVWTQEQCDEFPVFRVSNIRQLIEANTYDATTDDVLVRYHANPIFEQIMSNLDDDEVEYLADIWATKLAKMREKSSKKRGKEEATDRELVEKILKGAIKGYDKYANRWISGRLPKKVMTPELIEYMEKFHVCYEAAAEVRYDDAEKGDTWEKAGGGEVEDNRMWLSEGNVGYNMSGFSNANLKGKDSLKYEEVMAKVHEVDESITEMYYRKPTMSIEGAAVIWVELFKTDGREQYRIVSRKVQKVVKDLSTGGEIESSLELEAVGPNESVNPSGSDEEVETKSSVRR